MGVCEILLYKIINIFKTILCHKYNKSDAEPFIVINSVKLVEMHETNLSFRCLSPRILICLERRQCDVRCTFLLFSHLISMRFSTELIAFFHFRSRCTFRLLNVIFLLQLQPFISVCDRIKSIK